MSYLGKGRAHLLAAFISITVSGCGTTAAIIANEDVAVPPGDVAMVASVNNDPRCLSSDPSPGYRCRNNYIALKLYEIDQNFARYKILLSRGDAAGNLGADIAQIGLAATGAVIPVSQTTKVLTAASAAVGLANTAINKDVLLSQTMQIIEQQMSTARASVKATIIARMSCSPAAYPAGFVLTDLQEYADAGTVTGALNGIAKATANAQPTLNGSKGTATPTTTSTSAASTAASVAAVSVPPLAAAAAVPVPKSNCPLSPSQGS